MHLTHKYKVIGWNENIFVLKWCFVVNSRVIYNQHVRVCGYIIIEGTVGFITTYAISAYHHQCCEFESHSWWGISYTTLCDQVCRWLLPGNPFSSTNKTDHDDITEILLKVALSTITLTLILYFIDCVG
jgi:hypothetical protein